MQHPASRTVTGDYGIRQNPITMQCDGVCGKARSSLLFFLLKRSRMNEMTNDDARIAFRFSPPVDSLGCRLPHAMRCESPCQSLSWEDCRRSVSRADIHVRRAVF